MAIPFAVPSITQEEKNAVMEVLDNGWLTSGVKMKEFETRLADMVQNEVVCLNSATAGLHLALLSLDLKPEDEVIVPTITFAATAEVVAAVGAKIVLADVSINDQMLTIDDLQYVVTENTKVVMLVHMAGNVPTEYEAVLAWCGNRGIKVIEDAAHTFGARYSNGAVVGSAKQSYATVFSFYATKCITTGEGGAVCTADKELAAKLRQLRLHGISRDVFDRYTSDVPKWEYDVVAAGWKYNMTDMAAAIGLVQLRREASMREQRYKIALSYLLGLSPRLELPKVNAFGAHHLFVVWVPGDRNAFIEALYKQGIGCSVHFKPLHKMTAYAREGCFPNADLYFDGCVSLPIWAGMTDEQVNEVIAVVNAVAEDMYA